jgi:hypothetical protein
MINLGLLHSGGGSLQYTFFHIKPDDSVSSFDMLICDDHDDALSRALAAFAERRGCQRIEVLDERGALFTVERPQG